MALMYGRAGFDRPDGALRPSYNRATSHRFLAKPESSILNRAVVNVNVWYSYRTTQRDYWISTPAPALDHNY